MRGREKLCEKDDKKLAHFSRLNFNCEQKTFEVVFRLCVVCAHDGRRLPPDHEQDPDPGLGLGLEQLSQSVAAEVEFLLGLQQGPVVASEREILSLNIAGFLGDGLVIENKTEKLRRKKKNK